MGSIFSTNQHNLLMVGKYASGKKSIIQTIIPNYKFSVPMIGYNCEFVQLSKSVKLTCLSVFNKKQNNIYSKFCDEITGLIFVDSCYIDDDIKYYLAIFANRQEVLNSKTLILANKCDLKNAKSRDEIYDELNLESYRGTFLLEMCSTITKIGINAGIQWLLE
ncbi:ADP-ribosylation_factor 1 [Hexamita inflata]|uniref:ADP-ribosylation_factor 1 n=1 Tax=Hexamita inflata TaxID=28002 RepID=A0ABP1GGL0_9EUKA